MKYNYFPGCTLKNKAKDLDRYARLSAERLGVEPLAPEVLTVPRVPRALPRKPRLPAVGRAEG